MVVVFAFALLAGIIFGFLLQKGGVTQFNTIVGQFLFKNMIVAEVISYALMFGGLFFYTASLIASYGGYDLVLPLSAGSLIAALLGGLIFGVGMALFGYCPGTGIAAFGQGSLDAGFGMLGMVGGAIFFEYFYSYLAPIRSMYVSNHQLIPVNLYGIVIIVLIICCLPYIFKFIKQKMA